MFARILSCGKNIFQLVEKLTETRVKLSRVANDELNCWCNLI